MSEASLAAQRLAVTAMRGNAALLALVPEFNIIDKSGRPERFPCIIVGEAQTVGDDTDCHDLSTVFLTIHAWAIEGGTAGVKTIGGAVRRALRDLEGTQDGFSLGFSFADTVFMRDPSGLHSHGVISFEVTAEDTNESG